MNSVSLMQEEGHSTLMLWDNPEGSGVGARWEGGSGFWDTCTPMAESCHCMAKSPQYCKVISLQLKLIN